MEEKEVFDRVKKIVVAQLGVAPESVTMATSFTKDLGADPVALIELEFALGEEFGIEISDADAEKIAADGEAVAYIIRNGAIHVLDSKPAARTNRPIAQLAINACALTRRAPGLKLFDIKCAWFNEEEYCEFFPRLLFRDPTRTDRHCHCRDRLSWRFPHGALQA